MIISSDFSNLMNEIEILGADQHPSELHGMLIGYLCANKNSDPSHRSALYEDWLGSVASIKLTGLLEGAYLTAKEALEEYSDFDFRILLPADDQHINERVASLSSWCSGFLSGFGEAGRHALENVSGDVAEAFQDLAKIAALAEEIPENEENEIDLAEIEEYVRISALLIFAETSSPGAH